MTAAYVTVHQHALRKFGFRYRLLSQKVSYGNDQFLALISEQFPSEADGQCISFSGRASANGVIYHASCYNSRTASIVKYTAISSFSPIGQDCYGEIQVFFSMGSYI